MGSILFSAGQLSIMYPKEIQTVLQVCSPIGGQTHIN